jgi:hypothetical protein
MHVEPQDCWWMVSAPTTGLNESPNKSLTDMKKKLFPGLEMCFILVNGTGAKS